MATKNISFKNRLRQILNILVYIVAALSVPLFILLISDLSDEQVVFAFVMEHISTYLFLTFCVPVGGLVFLLFDFVRNRMEERGSQTDSGQSGSDTVPAAETDGDLSRELKNYRKFRIFHITGLPLSAIVLIIVYFFFNREVSPLFLIVGLAIVAIYYILISRSRLRCFVTVESISERYSAGSRQESGKPNKSGDKFSASDIARGILYLLAYIAVLFDFVFFILHQVTNTVLPVFLYYVYYISIFANFYLIIFMMIEDMDKKNKRRRSFRLSI